MDAESKVLLRAHVIDRVRDLWRDGVAEILVRHVDPDGLRYEAEGDPCMLDGARLAGLNDMADPMDVSPADVAALVEVVVPKPTGLAEQGDFPRRVVLLVRGWSTADLIADLTGVERVDD